ncbi:MAG: hypothetical protein ACK559_29150, partial [bacterium]
MQGRGRRRQGREGQHRRRGQARPRQAQDQPREARRQRRLQEHRQFIEAEVGARGPQAQREGELHPQPERHRHAPPRLPHARRQRRQQGQAARDDGHGRPRLREVHRQRHQTEEVRQPRRGHEVGEQRQRQVHAAEA